MSSDAETCACIRSREMKFTRRSGMDVYEAIEKRRTIRIYKAPASEKQLLKIIMAGTKAPSAMNRQPWEFIIVDEKKVIGHLADLKYQLNRRDSPHHSIPEVVEENALEQKRSFENASVVAICAPLGWERSTWLCIENMSLAAVTEGLGSGIVLYWGKERKTAEKLLGVPRGFRLTAVLKFGIPGEEGYPSDKNPYAPRRQEFSWLHRNIFGNLQKPSA
jgi:nitroreductase